MDTVLGRLVLVACGGGAGAVARYGLDLGVRHLWPGLAARFPLGILVVNTLGCLCFGVIVGATGGFETLPHTQRLFLLTGVLGGFTTFSTFGHDTARLLESGALGLAVLNAAGSLILGVGSVFAGYWIGRHAA